MKTKTFWPYGIILAFAIFISGTACLIVLAVRQHSDLVSPNYYEQEVKYQGRLDSLERANRLAPPATVKYNEASGRVEITLPQQHINHATGQIELYRPSAAGLDQTFPLSAGANGIQNLDTTKLQPGLWKVRLTWTVDGKEFCLDQKIVVKKS